MTFDLQRILEGKRALRRKLASQPVADKLAMLDALRDRARMIHEAAARKEVLGQLAKARAKLHELEIGRAHV